MENENKQLNEISVGKNAVREAMRAGMIFDTVFISERTPALSPLLAECAKNGTVVKEVHPAKLNAMAGGANHQGVVGVLSCVKPAELEDIFASAEQKGQPPLILICDEIEDPHNLGALIRSAECAGFDGVIVPRHRSATLGGVVSKSSAGAVAHIPVVKVANLVDTIGKLKERGVWVYGAELDGVAYDRMDFTGATAIVVGSEGKGIGRLVKKNCDGLVTIPMFGKVNSLNASVAGGILMFAASTQRLRKK